MSASNISHLWQKYQIKINLEGTKPPVWRRLIVDSRVPLDALHHAIQISMGWTDSHLHQFIDMHENIYGENDEKIDFVDINEESEFMISDVLNQEKQSIWYEYDFGDSWRHKITLEKILPADNKEEQIQCIKGMRICPMEDSGGVFGYKNMLDILSDPQNEEYEDIKEWLGDEFDPDEKFILKDVQEYLKEFFLDVTFTTKKSNKRLTPNQTTITDFEDDFDPTILLDDPEVPEEIKMLMAQMLSSADVIEDLSNLLEDCYQAFEEISCITKDKKVSRITKKMMEIIVEKG
jgi:Plasmid pRiA4b ORF-3-like protein